MRYGVLAVGRYTHVFTWIYDYIPGINLFRRPADATYALGTMVSIASGYSLHLIVSGKETPDRKTKYVVLGVIAAMIAISLGVAVPIMFAVEISCRASFLTHG
jgi:hypothetical protein